MEGSISYITIIICSHNRSNYLSKLFDGISKLNIPKGLSVEVIFVDNASTDETAQIVQNYQSAIPLRYIYEGHLGHSIALNRGILECKGKLLLFTDDDAIVDQNWLIEYWRFANSHPDGGYFFGKIKLFLPENMPVPSWLALAPRSIKGRDQGEKPIRFTKFCHESYPIGINMAVLRECFLSAKPFDERLGPSLNTGLTGGADTKLGRDILENGYVGYYVPSAIVYHRIPPDRLNWSYIVKRAYLGGKASAIYKRFQSKITILSVPISLWARVVFKIFGYMFYSLIGNNLEARRKFLELMKAWGACQGSRIFKG